MISENKNIRFGVLISYVSLAVSILCALFITPIILNSIGKDNYGLYSFATSITSWLSVISTALAASYIRFASIENHTFGTTEKTNSVYLKIFTMISLIVLTIVIIGCPIMYLSHFSFGNYSKDQNNLVILLLAISGLQVAVSIVCSPFTHYCTYKKRFIFLRTLALAVSILTHVLNLIFAITTKSIVHIAASTAFVTIVSTAITIIFSIKKQNMRFAKSNFANEKQVFKKIIIFSSFIILNSVVDQINNNVDKTILGVMVNAESVTYYSLAKYFSTYLLALSTSISGVFAPKIHDFVNENNKEGINSIFLKVSKIQLILISFLIFGYISSGRYFINLWLGNEYEQVFYYGCVLLMLDLVPLSVNIGVEVQRAMNKHRFRAVLYIIFSIFNIFASILLIKILPSGYEIWGAIIGTVLSIVCGNWIILNIYNKKVIDLPIGKYFIGVFKISSFGMAGIGISIMVQFLIKNFYFSNLVMFAFSGISFSLIYILLIIIFERKTIKNIFSFLKRK